MNFDQAVQELKRRRVFVRSRYERGRVLETLGERDLAVENYERSIAAWADGDEGVQPLVEDARAALARLRDGP